MKCTIEDLRNGGLGDFIDNYCKIVQEPEHSKKQLKQLQEKYKITDKDMDKIIFNVRIMAECNI